MTIRALWLCAILWIVVAQLSCAEQKEPSCPLLLQPSSVFPRYTYDYSSRTFTGLFTALNRTIESLMTNNRIPYHGITLVHGKHTIYRHGLTSTQFRIASITKTITALGALILREQGRLSIDDPVKKFLPDFSIMSPYGKHDTTLRELMGHVAGFPRDLCSLVFPTCETNEVQILKNVAKMQLIQPPWSNSPAYSNLGISMLGRAWEKATSPSMSWEDYVMENIVKPLGMRNTGIDLADAQLAPNTDPDADVDLGWLRPAAQMYSTADDLAHYLKFMLTGQPALISDSSRHEWFSPATMFDDGQAGYAFPFELRKLDPDSSEFLVTKAGDIYGYRSHIAIDQSNQIGVAVLTAYEPGSTSSPGAFVDSIMRLVTPVVQSENQKVLAASYAGLYSCERLAPFSSPTLNYKVQVLIGNINVSVSPTLGLIAQAKMELMNEAVPVAVDETWSLLLKNATDNSFWFGDGSSCDSFTGSMTFSPDVKVPNVPGSLYTNVLVFDLAKGSVEWPAVGGKCYKSGFSSAGVNFHPRSSSYLIVWVMYLIYSFTVLYS